MAMEIFSKINTIAGISSIFFGIIVINSTLNIICTYPQKFSISLWFLWISKFIYTRRIYG